MGICWFELLRVIVVLAGFQLSASELGWRSWSDLMLIKPSSDLSLPLLTLLSTLVVLVGATGLLVSLLESLGVVGAVLRGV